MTGNRFQGKNSGISLIELLVCITIVGILMGMMFPVFSKAIKKARSLGSPVDPNDNTKGQYAPSSVPHLNNYKGTKPQKPTSPGILLSDTIKDKRLELTNPNLPNGCAMFAQFTANGKAQVWSTGSIKIGYSGTYVVNGSTIEITKKNGDRESWNFSTPIISWGCTINTANTADGTYYTLTIIKVQNL